MEDPRPTLQPSERQPVRIPLDEIQIGALAMRASMDPAELTELSLSLSRIGQHTPVSVVRAESGFELIMGHRRCAAAAALGWTHVDAFVESRDNATLWALAWSENHNRAEVSPSDQAEWLDKMRSQNGFTQAQLAAVTGLGESHISDLLAIKRYPEPLREALDAGAIVLGVARALFRIDDPNYQMFYLHQACEHGASVRTAEEWVRNLRLEQMTRQDDDTEPPDVGQLPPQTSTFVQICSACLQEATTPLSFLPVCPGCRQLITNPATA